MVAFCLAQETKPKKNCFINGQRVNDPKRCQRFHRNKKQIAPEGQDENNKELKNYISKLKKVPAKTAQKDIKKEKKKNPIIKRRKIHSQTPGKKMLKEKKERKPIIKQSKISNQISEKESKEEKKNKKIIVKRMKIPAGTAQVRIDETGEGCEYVVLSDLTFKGTGCVNGAKFVIKKGTNSRRQYVIMNDKILLLWVKIGSKFKDCPAFTDRTATITCKEVVGLAAVNLGIATVPVASTAGVQPASSASSAAAPPTTAASSSIASSSTAAPGALTSIAPSTTAAPDSAASSTSNISVTSASTALSTTASVLPSSAASTASAASAASAASPTSAAPDASSQVI